MGSSGRVIFRGAAFLAAGVFCNALSAQTRPQPNIVLITVDTLRADHLGCYGYKLIRTPNIDRLAAAGTRFTTVVSAAPLTLPAHSSIMTGAYPAFHGVHDNVGYRLSPSVETLAQILKARGYATGGVVGAYILDRAFGLSTGFDFYYDHFDEVTDQNDTVNMAQLKRSGSQVIDQAIAWVKRTQKRPFFLWAHLYDPHDPYNPPAPFQQEYAASPYDGEIAYVDQQIGRLAGFLREAGLYQNTLIVLTADHGESLGEHRELRHGYFVYDATLLVPLIIKPPGAANPSTVDRQVRSIDIAPTILKLAGIPKGKMMQGTDLSAANSAPEAYSETFYPAQFGWSTLRSLRVNNLKYIEAPRPELYDLAKDSGESNNQAAQRPAVAGELRAKLINIELSAKAPDEQRNASKPLTPEEIDKLARLGYVANSSAVSARAAKSLPDPKDEIETFYSISRAGIEAASGKCDQAIPDLLEIVRKSPNLEAARSMLGRCYFIQERFQDAMKAFLELEEINPQNEDAAFYLAACKFNLDDLTGAEEGFRHTLSLNLNRAYAHKYLGFIYQAKGDSATAIAEFTKVVELSPRDLEAHGKLGFLLASASRMKDALPHFQKVVELSPADASAHYNLGLAYEKLADRPKAARELAEACKLDRQFCGK
jgi:arylsulfatase A-like enzyme/Flp pilus assembly protein TadD